MTPQTVNAVNLPAMNAMNFPAAILQPPYFDPARPRRWTTAPSAPSSATRSATASTTRARCSTPRAGCTTGGRRRTSRTSRRRRRSSPRSTTRYKPFPDLALNGKQTLGENIADVAGLTAAYDAYHLSLGGKPAPVVAGLHRRPAVLHRASRRAGGPRSASPRSASRSLTDGHAPGEYRATRCATSTRGTRRST